MPDIACDEVLIAVTETLIDNLCLSLPPSPDDTLEHLGCDALDVLELQIILEEEFRIMVTDDDVNLTKTVGDLADVVRKNRA